MASEQSKGSNSKVTVATTPSSLIVDEETTKLKVTELEEMFKDRYSEKDEDFVATKSKPVPPPPCVTFYTRPKRRPYDRSRQGNRDGGYQGYRGRRDNYHGDRRHDNRNQGSRYHPYSHRDHDDNPYRIRHDDRY